MASRSSASVSSSAMVPYDPNSRALANPSGVNSRAVVSGEGRRASLRSSSLAMVPYNQNSRAIVTASASTVSASRDVEQPAKKKRKSSGKKGKRVLLIIFNVVSTLLVSSNRILLF